jgi:hypothetical protein
MGGLQLKMGDKRRRTAEEMDKEINGRSIKS